MSLRGHVQSAVQAGLRATGDMRQSADYTSVATPSYDPSAGAITLPKATHIGVPVLFTNFSRMEIDGQAIRAEDQKAIMATRDLPATPTVNDTITLADGIVWRVIGIKTDPAGAAWVLHVRTP